MNADTRGRIVRTAMELFWAKGFQSTSIADILSRSQLHAGSLYHFFPGKQQLLEAVLEAYRDGIERMTKINKGRAFYTTPEQLGRFVEQVHDDRFYALWLLVVTTGFTWLALDGSIAWSRSAASGGVPFSSSCLRKAKASVQGCSPIRREPPRSAIPLSRLPPSTPCSRRTTPTPRRRSGPRCPSSTRSA